jgi:MEDS: MEthanogen/methylotroph, DcmR Sensory domain
MSAGLAPSAETAPPERVVPSSASTRHGVQFYRHDDELADSVGSYLGETLAVGSAVVLIATAAHRSACEGRMTAAGADLAAATASGAYTALEAASLMRSFLAGDRDQPGGFMPVITDVLRRATAAGPAVVFGEIVAQLWADGHLSAAVELESVWNELARGYPFSLVCAYPVPARQDRPDEAAQLEEVAALHSAVLGSPAPGSPAGGPEAVRGYLRSRGAPRAARHFVTGTLRQWGGPWDEAMLAVDAGIVATELATNAVLHARSDFTIAVSQRPGAVRIAVRDAVSAGLPPVAAPGHGLAVLEKVAARWGAEPLPAGGKQVWAELACPR